MLMKKVVHDRRCCCQSGVNVFALPRINLDSLTCFDVTKCSFLHQLKLSSDFSIKVYWEQKKEKNVWWSRSIFRLPGQEKGHEKFNILYIDVHLFWRMTLIFPGKKKKKYSEFQGNCQLFMNKYITIELSDISTLLTWHFFLSIYWMLWQEVIIKSDKSG